MDPRNPSMEPGVRAASLQGLIREGGVSVGRLTGQGPLWGLCLWSFNWIFNWAKKLSEHSDFKMSSDSRGTEEPNLPTLPLLALPHLLRAQSHRARALRYGLQASCGT